MTEIILKSSTAVISAIVGAVILFSISLNHKKLCGLISFAAGALLGAATISILPSAFNNLSLIEIIISAASGYLLFYLISKYFAHVCPACSATHFDEKTTQKFSEIVLTMMIALSIHSFLDGIALSSGNSDAHGHDNSVFIAITTHKFPEGLALAALMLGSGYRKIKIIVYVVLVELTTLVGGITGIYLIKSGVSASVMNAVMAHIAGGFIFLAFHAIFGEMWKNHKLLVISSFTGGILLIYLVHSFIG